MKTTLQYAAWICALLLLAPALRAAEATPAEKEEIAKLIKQLGADDFGDREAALGKLKSFGAKALDDLKTAAQSNEPEIKKRAGDLLLWNENIAVVTAMENNSYYPLRVGNIWEYTAGPMTISAKVEGYEKVGESYCAKVVTYNNGQQVNYECLTVREDGVYRCAFQGNAVTPALKVIALPAKNGDTWKIDSEVLGQKITGTNKLTDVKDLKVGENTYQAISVSTDDMKVSGVDMGQTMYFAKDVGLVKQELLMGGQKIEIQLTKFTSGLVREERAEATSVKSVPNSVGKPSDTAPPASVGK